MKIEFNDKGVIATATITSTVFEFRLHNRAVDTALFLAPSVRAKRSGFFVLKTVITGKTSHVLRAYKTIKAEASR
ncbi:MULTISPECIES: hypothetical protein [Klebsiella pneumoniae complex]|uniref:hypothetical protein n=1 Tax=Klebsiella pneumoniae complex TaxID=3390273 RepID=UPI00218195ED|nr:MULTISPECIES: hypothetical protein [Klebsiella]EKX8421053.1 hypothetical protein [Klebsiella pneumoniae]MCU8818643.1 hypothetical protein [Klebsiella quasipneumoniae]MDV1351746.1 hypothetical protein [Klebsiella quasipneumoniae subsp. similipneumoniae]MDV1366411.1 hypothetical protein [Klebsiella quasipneumoniae subsp. similipneumoniae]GKI46705.1 hypothetical protein NUBL22018_35640 [Klebsiella variicola]